MPEVVVLDALESCRCVFIHLFVSYFYPGEGLIEGLHRPDFFLCSSLSVLLTTNPMCL
jgi:hypothetical protein